MFPVVVVPYDPTWPAMLDAERASLANVLGELDPDIEHIGSTSVPGLAAKPKIDILVGLRRWDDLASAIERLSVIGYEHEPQLTVPRHFSMKRGHPTTHRVHLVEQGGGLWQDYLAFRDALRSDLDLCGRYARVKQELASRHAEDHAAYMAGKAPLIEQVLGRERSRRGKIDGDAERTNDQHPGVDYDPRWPGMFDEPRRRLEPAVAGIASSIEHIGSTAVPRLAAKPILDIDVVVRDDGSVSTAIERLQRLGSAHEGDLGVPG